MFPSEPGPRLFPEDRATEILSTRCGAEVLQVLDDTEYRWLKYRYGALQSAMNKRLPERLVLPYTRAMASILLFVPDPGRILILGLGGGSLVRFFLLHYPNARLTVVEREPQCVTIAHEFFSVPRDHPGLDVITGDARDVVSGLGDHYDLVMLDLFLAHGPPSWLGIPDVFDACRSRMRGDGALSANLWAEPDDADLRSFRGVSAAFGGRMLLIPVPGYRNVIVHAFCPGHDVPELAALRARARGLSDTLHFDAHGWLRVIASTNRVEGSRLAL